MNSIKITQNLNFSLIITSFLTEIVINSNISSSNLPQENMNCTLHKSFPLQYFCQTCMDPICSECIKSNPHSNEYHRISTIQEAVENRRQRFQLFVQNQINPLRQKIRQKFEQIKQIQSLQLVSRNSILKDIMLEFEAIDHRTKQKSEKKILEYQTEIKHYQAYLNSLDDVAYTFEKTSSDPYNFLILYQDVHNQLKSLELKEIREKIERFQINRETQEFVQIKQIQNSKLIQQLDFPRQIKSTYQKISQIESLKERNLFLNSLIAQACQDYQNEQKKLKVNGETEYKKKLHIFNDITKNIIELNCCKACAFCGFTFTLQTANDQCAQNKSIRAEVIKRYLHINIDPQLKGTKRHYWVNSSIEDRKVPDPNGHPLIRIKQKRQFLNSLKDLQIVRCCFRKYEIDNAKVENDNNSVQVNSFMQVFQKSDKQNKGFLSKITFKYILTKTFEMNALHCDVLTQLLSYKWKAAQKIDEEKSIQVQKLQKVKEGEQKGSDKTEGVNYKLLKQFMINPELFYEQWQKVEQDSQKSKPIGPTSKQTSKYKSRY